MMIRQLFTLICVLFLATTLRAEQMQTSFNRHGDILQRWSTEAPIRTGQIVKMTANHTVALSSTTDRSGAIGVAVTAASHESEIITVSVIGNYKVSVDGTCIAGETLQISSTINGYAHCTRRATKQPLGLALTGRPGVGTIRARIDTQDAVLSPSNDVPLSRDNKWSGNQRFCGVVPWSDITCKGARAIAGGPQGLMTTVTFRSGSPNVTVEKANFINGDGVTIQDAGAAMTMSTPLAPKVTPSYASGGTRSHLVVDSPIGGSLYSYCVFAEDKGGGLTSCSSRTTITNGLSTLGLQTAMITSVSLSDDTLTVNLSSGTALTPGQEVQVVAPVARFTGEMRVATARSGSFTITNYVSDSRLTGSNIADFPNAVTGSGMIYYFAGNKINWPMVKGARRFWVCAQRPGDRSMHVVGQSDISDILSGWQGTQFEDWGPSYESNQSWPIYINDSDCTGGGQRDALTTTVLSGGGTTHLTLMVNAQRTDNTNTKTINLDAAPAIQAAASQVANGVGCIYIPPATLGWAYPINSFLTINSSGVCIKQAGTLALNDTIEGTGNLYWFADWTGGQTTQFGFDAGAGIVTYAANPTFHFAGNTIHMSGVNFVSSGGTNGETLIAMDARASILDHVSLVTANTSNNDTLGVAVIYRSTSGTISVHKIENSSLSGGPNQVTGASWTPLILVPTGQNGSGGFQNSGIQLALDQIYANRRSIEVDSGFGVQIHHYYIQGPIMPVVLFSPQVGGVGPVDWDDVVADTTGEPLIANLGAGSLSITLTGVSSSVSNPLISGARPVGVTYRNYFFSGSATPVNRWSTYTAPLLAVVAPYDINLPRENPAVSQQIIGEANAHHFVGDYPEYWDLPAPTGVTVSSSHSGGSMPSGTFLYAVSAVGYDGGDTIPSIPSSSSIKTSGSCPASGNCSLSVSWNPVAGAFGGYNVWRCNTLLVGGCLSTSGFIAGGNWIKVGFHVSGTSFTDEGHNGTMNIFPTVTGTGISWMKASSAGAPVFVAIPRSFSALAACNSGTQGTTGTVTDSTVNTWGETIVGGGLYTVLAFCDGTNWTVYGK